MEQPKTLTIDPHAPLGVAHQRLVRPTAREIYNETRRNIRYRDKLLRMGASKQTIAKALGINENSPILAELA
jgi:hypothetical protein